jgi:hypothetical protein
MASGRTFIQDTGTKYTYDRDSDTVTVVYQDGHEAHEKMSDNLAERLVALGVPDVLWRGSPGAILHKDNCPFCKDTGQAWGLICVCVRN